MKIWERRKERMEDIISHRSHERGITTYKEMITEGVYNSSGQSFQTFSVHEGVDGSEDNATLMPCDYVNFYFTDNYGNPYYTSIYRLMVHPFVEQ